MGTNEVPGIEKRTREILAQSKKSRRASAPQAFAHVRAAIRSLESALSTSAIKEATDVVVCQAEGRLMSALEGTKEALFSLEDVLA